MEDILIASLVNHLKTLTAVTAIVGSGDAAVIRPGQLDEEDNIEDADALVVNIARLNRENDLSGIAGLVYSDIIINCLSRNVTNAWTLSKAVRLNGVDPGTGLAGFSGSLDTIPLVNICKNEDIWTWSAEGDGSDEIVHSIASHYELSYPETT